MSQSNGATMTPQPSVAMTSNNTTSLLVKQNQISRPSIERFAYSMVSSLSVMLNYLAYNFSTLSAHFSIDGP